MRISETGSTSHITNPKKQSQTNSDHILTKNDANKKIMGDQAPTREGKNAQKTSHESLINKEMLEIALEELDELNRIIDKGFQFQIHEGSDRIWVQVIDKHTDEIIREVPPEQVLDIVAGLKEIVGLLIDEKL